MRGRLAVNKTYKLYIGGQFVRSESGRSLTSDASGDNVPWGSRKDLRDAVRAAAAAWPGWSARSGMNRGQILYRIAEMLESRQAEFEELVVREGGAESEVGAACDRLVHYAGWADKFAQEIGSVNPVAGPYFNFSVPEPMGVVGVVVAPGAPLLAIVSQLAPIVCGGNVAVILAHDSSPITACELAEVLASSDVPNGVVNILTGHQTELLPWLLGHMGVAAVDCTANPPSDDLVRAASENVKRLSSPDCSDWTGAQGIEWIERFQELKTVWHPVGV